MITLSHGVLFEHALIETLSLFWKSENRMDNFNSKMDNVMDDIALFKPLLLLREVKVSMETIQLIQWLIS